MKRTVLTIVAMLFTATLTFAQTSEYTLSAENEKKCTELTRAMVNDLRLNELGYIKLKALNRERIAKAEKVMESTKDDPAKIALKLEEVEKEFDQKLTAVLDASQMQAYTAYKSKSVANLIAVLESK